MIYATVVSVIYCINFNFKYFCRIMYIHEREYYYDYEYDYAFYSVL